MVFFENRGESKQRDREKPERFFREEGFELDFEDRLGWPSIEIFWREGHSRQNSMSKAWRQVRAGRSGSRAHTPGHVSGALKMMLWNSDSICRAVGSQGGFRGRRALMCFLGRSQGQQFGRGPGKAQWQRVEDN